MRHTATKSNIMVADVELRFADVYQKPYFSTEYADEVKKANLLLLPSENIRENLEPVFPEFTTDFLWYIREHASRRILPDIAVDDENYHVMLLYSSFVALSTLLIREEILPETCNLTIGFLKELAQRNHRSTEELDAFVNIIVEGKDSCRKIMFSGRVSELDGALESAIQQGFPAVASKSAVEQGFPATALNSDSEQGLPGSALPSSSERSFSGSARPSASEQNIPGGAV